jgi:phosphoenolpyruvate carboxylase
MGGSQIPKTDSQIPSLDEILTEHQAIWDGSGRTQRHHPALRLAEDIVSGRAGTLDVATILDDLNEGALVARGDQMAAYFGTTNVLTNKDQIRQAITRLAYNPDGSKRTAQDFAKRLNGIYGAVFTGHPTFSNHPETYKSLAEYFTACAAGHASAAQASELQLRNKANLKFETPTLDGESAQSLEAIKNLHRAVAIVEEIAIEVGHDEYPQEWKTINYAPHTVATWIPFDWDGRDDISWNVLLEKRIALQIEMMTDYAHRFQQLKEDLDEAHHSKIDKIWNNLDFTITKLENHRRFFRDYDPAKDTTGAQLAKAEAAFADGAKDRITHPALLIEAINDILAQDVSHQAAKGLVHLRSRLDNHGLSLAHVHFRINSKSVNKALRSVDINVNEDIPAHEHDNIYGAKLKSRMDGLAGQASKPMSLAEIAQSNDVLKKQMGLIRFITANLDSHSPVRFLLAETHNSLVPRAVLSFAKEAGVEAFVDISPLFEDRDGINAAKEIVGKLYADRHFREYVQARGVAAFQFGYSDSGRFDGQLPAGAFIELVKGEIILQHDKYGLHNIPVKFFDTHGESIGRGAHPESVAERLRYIDTDFTLGLAGAKGVDIEAEESFQGGDGYVLMGTPDAALSYLAQALTHFAGDHTKARNDIYYDSEARKGSALAFFANARRAQSLLSQDQNNAALIELFGNMMFPTGSRPKKRRAASGGERELPRAIPHNGIFAQLGALVNVMYGISEAIKADPEGYEDLMRNSPAFRARMALVERAMDLSDPYILKSYVELYNPSFWHDRARALKDPAARERCRDVAHHMRELGHYPKFAPIVQRIIEDFEVIKAARESLDLPSDPMKDRAYKAHAAHRKMNMNTVHGLRLASMIDLFTQTVATPETVLQNSHRDEFIRAALSLDLDAIRKLEVSSAANDNSPETLWSNRLKASVARITRASQVQMNLVCAVG